METDESIDVMIRCMDGELWSDNNTLSKCEWFAAYFRRTVKPPPGLHYTVKLFEFETIVVKYFISYLVHGRNTPIPRGCFEKIRVLFDYLAFNFLFETKISSIKIEADINIFGLIREIQIVELNANNSYYKYIKINNIEYRIGVNLGTGFHDSVVTYPDDILHTPGDVTITKNSLEDSSTISVFYYKFKQ